MKRELPKTAFDHLNHLIAPGSVFMESFEHAKTLFGLDYAPDVYRLPLNIGIGRAFCSLPYYHDSTFFLSKHDLQSLFDPVILKIFNLVNSQIMTARKEYGLSFINVGTHPTRNKFIKKP